MLLSEMPSQPPRKLLDQVRDKLRFKHYSLHTEETYMQWIRRFILFHNKQHPNEMREQEVEQFLTHLAVRSLDPHSGQVLSDGIIFWRMRCSAICAVRCAKRVLDLLRL